MASIINTYDANSTLVYPKTSTEALLFDGGRLQGAEAIAAALSEEHEDLEIGNIVIVDDHELRTPTVIAGSVDASYIKDKGNLIVDGNTNLNNGLNVNTGSVSVKLGGIDVSGNIDVFVGRVKAPKADFDNCSFGPIHIDGNANKINVTVNTTFGNGAYNYTLQQLATQTGAERHLSYSDTSLYVTGVARIANSSKTYTDPSVFIKNGTLYTKGLYVGGNQIDPTKIVLKQTATNLISSNNEFNFIKADYNNSVAINYRAENNGIGNITKYTFYNGTKMVGGYAEIDAALYRCRGGHTYLHADPSANGQLVIGSQDPSTKTSIQTNGVVIESPTGISTLSRDSMILDSTNRYIKNAGTRLLAGNPSGNNSLIATNPSYIGLYVVNGNTESMLSLAPNQIYIDSPVVNMDSHARVNGDASVYGKLNVVGDSSMNGKFKVQGDSSLYGKLYVNNDVSMNGKFKVQGDSSLYSKLYVGGDVSISGILNVNGGNTIKSTGSYLLGDVSYGGNTKRYDRPNDLYRGSSIPMHGLMIYTMDKCDYAAGSSGQVLNYANDLPIGYAPCGVVISASTQAVCDTYLSNYHKNCIIPFLKKMLPDCDTSDFKYTTSVTHNATLPANIRWRGKFTNIVTIGREGNIASINIPDLPPYKTAANEDGAQITMVYMVRIW